MASASPSHKLSHHEYRHVWLAHKRSCDVVVRLLQKNPAIASSCSSCENREDELVAKKHKHQKSELALPKPLAAAEDGHSSDDGEEEDDDDGSSQKRKRKRIADVCIHLHAPSRLLARSHYFASLLSEPWCKLYQQQQPNGSPLELTIETGVTTLLAYQRCIELLCSPQPCSPYSFKSPTDALEILLAADRLLFEECSSACMEYLAAAPWSRDDEVAIRRMFLTVSLTPSSDLAARLGFAWEKNLEAFKSMLHSLYLYDDRLYGCELGDSVQPFPEYPYEPYLMQTHEEFEGFVRAYLAEEESPPCLKEVIRNVLHEIWSKQSQHLKVNEQLDDEEAFWIWMHFTEFVLDIDDGKWLVQAFACDKEFQGVFSREFMLHFLQLHPAKFMARRLFDVLMLVFQRVAQARVILSAAARRSLLKAWLPRMREMINKNFYDPRAKISAEKAVIQIMKTLPMDDKLMLECMAIGYVEDKSKTNFSLREALYSWGDRLQVAMDEQVHNSFNKICDD